MTRNDGLKDILLLMVFYKDLTDQTISSIFQTEIWSELLLLGKCRL